jgi:DNA-binding winged helix-turn-helix (wHTH) protein
MSTQLSPITERLEPEPAVSLTFPSRYLRFGNFQVDVQRQELFLDGQRVKMQAKVFQALALLIKRAGEIVTRDEVRKHLWPDTFLSNLDANVNTTMNKLRQVLGDSPDNPRFIETIPRRGYSFIASLQYSDVASAPTQTAVAAAETPAPSVTENHTRFSVPHHEWSSLLRIAGLLIAGMLIGALLTFVWFVAQEKSHRPLESAQKRHTAPSALAE